MGALQDLHALCLGCWSSCIVFGMFLLLELYQIFMNCVWDVFAFGELLGLHAFSWHVLLVLLLVHDMDSRDGLLHGLTFSSVVSFYFPTYP